MATNKAQYMREYMAQYRLDGKEKTSSRAASVNRPFSGIDGEGASLDNGYHAYFMLRAGKQTLRAEGDNVRLSTLQCLDFIAGLDPKALHVGYFFDYDSTKVLEDLPFEKLRRLVTRALRTGVNGQLFPVDYGNFQVDYLPNKEFKVRKRLSQQEDETVWSPWVTVSDVGSFFQMSFLRALEVWNIGTAEEREHIRVGKLARASFDVKDFDDIAFYNGLEIKLLQELMDAFRSACVKAGYVPRKWQGPGQLAETMLRTHGVPKSADVPLLNDSAYEGLLQFGLNAYYGGRFEVAQVGPVNVPIVQYDINSAYPHAMRFVPCLLHGGWEYVADYSLRSANFRGPAFSVPTGARGESFALCFGTFRPKKSRGRTLWYGLPVRTAKGSIVFPASGSGWYWSHEIASAVHQDFAIEQAWIYTRRCDCRPLALVEDVYAERQRIGKDGPGLILKLGLNSLYGKMVQSIGSPKYSNAVWGSFITSFPRMMINDFIHSSDYCKGGSCGRDVVMVATDSVASLVDRSDYMGAETSLGGWSSEAHSNGMFVVQPGVYFGSSGKPTKTRGFTRTVVDAFEPQFRQAFRDMLAEGDLNIGQIALPVKVFAGIRYALHRRDMKLLGQWLEYGEQGKAGKVMSFDWTSKRHPMAINPTERRPWIITLPYEGSTDTVTVPYSKNIGGLMDREESRLAFADMPDWSPVGDLYEQ